jgi:hypothetical protein
MPELRRCPWSQITSEAWQAFLWWSDWRSSSILPFPGTMAEQPHFVAEAIQIGERVAGEVRASRLDVVDQET